MSKIQVKREITVFKNIYNDIVIRLVKPGEGYFRGKEIEYIMLSQEEANKLKELL